MMTCPVMKLPAPEASSSAGPTISSGWAARRRRAAPAEALHRPPHQRGERVVLLGPAERYTAGLWLRCWASWKASSATCPNT